MFKTFYSRGLEFFYGICIVKETNNSFVRNMNIEAEKSCSLFGRSNI